MHTLAGLPARLPAHRDRELAKFEAFLNKEECLNINAFVRERTKLAYAMRGWVPGLAAGVRLHGRHACTHEATGQRQRQRLPGCALQRACGSAPQPAFRTHTALIVHPVQAPGRHLRSLHVRGQEANRAHHPAHAVEPRGRVRERPAAPHDAVQVLSSMQRWGSRVRRRVACSSSGAGLAHSFGQTRTNVLCLRAARCRTCRGVLAILFLFAGV